MDNRIKVTLKSHQNFLLKAFMEERSITSPSKALVELLDVLLDAIEITSISSNEDMKSLVVAMLKTFESKQI